MLEKRKYIFGILIVSSLLIFTGCSVRKNVRSKEVKFDDMRTGRKPYEVLLEVLGEREIPFIADFDCCHTHPMLTLPIGAQIRLDASNKKISMIKAV